MTSTAHTTLLDHDEVHLTGDESADEAIELLRRFDEQRHKPECGLAWIFKFETDIAAPSLLVGVRGDVGAALWFDTASALAPAEGDTAEWRDYFSKSGQHVGIGVELPIEHAFMALREFMRTQQRPASVHWANERDVRPPFPVDT